MNWSIVVTVLALAAQSVASEPPASGSALPGNKAGLDLLSTCQVSACALSGVGLVVGLPGDGDDLATCPQAAGLVKAELSRHGIESADVAAFDGSVAAVLVQADVHAEVLKRQKGTLNAGPHSRAIDLTLYRVCKRVAIHKGTLLTTSLHGADGAVYGVGFGAIKDCVPSEKNFVTCIQGGGTIL